MKKILSIMTALVVMVSLSAIVFAAGSGEYRSPGLGTYRVTLDNTPHAIMNEVEVEFTHNGETKTDKHATPNPNGPADDARETSEVEFSDGMKFRVHNGKVQYRKPSWTSWTTMVKEGDSSASIDGKTFLGSLDVRWI